MAGEWPMTILVCGGRDYRNRERVYQQLDRYKPARIVCGDATGADALAAEWGRDRGALVERFKADWREHGRAAGPIRNQRMLDEGRPNLVLAFPGGRGTADMVRRARATSTALVEVGDG